MRILTCASKSVHAVRFSDAAQRLIVFTGKPHLEIHSLHITEPPVTMDKAPPRVRRVVGYSDDEGRIRIIPAPHDSQRIFSTDSSRMMWSERDSGSNAGVLHSATLRGENWQPDWIATHPHPSDGGHGFIWLRRFFDTNRRFLFGWYEQVHTRTDWHYRSRLGVGDAADGRELSASPPFVGAVELACASDSSSVVAVGVSQGVTQSAVVDRLLIYPDGAVDGEPVERRTRSPLTALAADPFGRFLLSAAGTRVTVWDAGTWKPARTFDWKIGRVTCLAVSDDGTVAAAGGDRGKVVVWDVE